MIEDHEPSPILPATEAVRKFLEFAEQNKDYSVYNASLTIPLPAEKNLSTIWTAVETATEEDLDRLRDCIRGRDADCLYVYAFRMASYALRLRSSEPAAWGILALGFGSYVIVQPDVVRYLVPPCDALDRLGISRGPFLQRGERLAFLRGKNDFVEKPDYPASLAAQSFDVVETDSGPLYVPVWWGNK